MINFDDGTGYIYIYIYIYLKMKPVKFKLAIYFRSSIQNIDN